MGFAALNPSYDLGIVTLVAFASFANPLRPLR